MVLIDRRAVLSGIVAAALPALPAAASAHQFLGARADGSGRYFATGFDTAGRVAFDLSLPGRGHGIAIRPASAEAAFFARRPGDYLTVIDRKAGKLRFRVDAAPGRWLNGHGIYDEEGHRLYVTETVAESGDGVIGVYDAMAGYRRLGEFPSGGLDPHDIRLLADGRTLVVANGGILTLSGAPRLQVNLDDMHPSLVYLDAADGSRLATHRLGPEQQKIGIRHLAVAGDGTVAIAMQYAGPAGDPVPLVGLHRPGLDHIAFIELPAPLLAGLRGYCGSAAIDAGRNVLAITSPRGNLAVFWDLAAGRCLGAAGITDGCGVVADGHGGFLIGSGVGGMYRFDPAAPPARRVALSGLEEARWDNHMVAATT